MSLYRQKSFFNRWKNKSIKGATPPSGGRPGAAASSRGAAAGSRPSGSTSSTASTSYRYKTTSAGYSGSSDGGRGLYHSRENIPMKDADGLSASSGNTNVNKSPRSRHRTDESRLGSAPGVGASWTSVASTSRESGVTRHSPPSSPQLHDSSAQTDEELLKYLLPGLRRRNKKHEASSPAGSTSNKSPSSSEDSHMGLGAGVGGAKNGRSSSGLRGRLSSASSRSSYHNNNTADGGTTYDATSAVHHVSVNEFEIMDETDSLLENEHKADTLDTTPRLAVGEQSPLLGGEHSPLLTHSTDEKFTSCYSTSEETLSDRHVEPFDDLDDLLTGVEPHQGSFGSLSAAENNARRPSPIDIEQQLVDVEPNGKASYRTEQETTPYQGSAGNLYDRLSTYSSRETCLSDTSDDSGMSPNRLRSTSSAPTIGPDQGDKTQGPGRPGDAKHPNRPSKSSLLSPVSAASGHIPHIQVQYATPCPSDSSTPSDRSLDGGHRSSIDSKGDPGSRRTSGDSTGRTSSFTSLDELSLNGAGTPAISAHSGIMSGTTSPKPAIATKPAPSGLAGPLSGKPGQSGSLTGSGRPKTGPPGSLVSQPISTVAQPSGLVGPPATKSALSGSLVGPTMSKAGPGPSPSLVGPPTTKAGLPGSIVGPPSTKAGPAVSLVGPSPTKTAPSVSLVGTPPVKSGLAGSMIGPSPTKLVHSSSLRGPSTTRTGPPPAKLVHSSSLMGPSPTKSALTGSLVGPQTTKPGPTGSLVGPPSTRAGLSGSPATTSSALAGQASTIASQAASLSGPAATGQGQAGAGPRGAKRDNDSVQEFQEYLRTRGLDLDLSVVQSSDV